MLIISVVPLLWCAASAQDGSEAVTSRTPEGAQRFLASELPSQLGVDTYGSKKDAVTKVTSADICTTSFEITPMIGRWVYKGSDNLVPDDVIYQSREGVNTMTMERKDFRDLSRPERTFTVNWALVRAVEPDIKLGVKLIAPSSQESSGTLYFHVTELRNRAAAAMDFLRAYCDPTKDSGF